MGNEYSIYRSFSACGVFWMNQVRIGQKIIEKNGEGDKEESYGAIRFLVNGRSLQFD